MNKADQERLLELKIHVWHLVAKALIEKEVKDPYILPGYDIERHRGRIGKAIKLLTDAGVVCQVKKDAYEVLKLEEAKELATKPVFSTRWDGVILGEVNTDITLFSKLNKAGYKIIERFSKSEILYIYFYRNKFNIIKDKNDYHDNTWDIYYPEELMVFRNKMVLKCLVEIELQNNFPQYIQHYAGYDSGTVYPSVKEEFDFRKYAISSVFLNGELDAIFECYTNNTNKANAMHDAFNKTIAWVKSVGGYQEAIKIIRKQIIKDFTDNSRRFPACLCEDDNNRLIDYSGRFKFVNKNKDLFNYETLYLDPTLMGEEVLNLEYDTGGYHRSDTLESINIKEEFDEPENEGDALKEQVA